MEPSSFRSENRLRRKAKKTRKDFADGVREGAAIETDRNEGIFFGDNQKAQAILLSMNQVAYEGLKNVVLEHPKTASEVKALVKKAVLLKKEYDRASGVVAAIQKGAHHLVDQRGVKAINSAAGSNVVSRIICDGKQFGVQCGVQSLTVGTKEKSGRWENKDGSLTASHRKDVGAHARVACPYGISSISATAGTSTTQTVTSLDTENHKKSEQETSLLTGVRASADVCGIEVVDLSSGRGKSHFTGQEAKNFSGYTEVKVYEKEETNTKILGRTVYSNVDNAKVHKKTESEGVLKSRTVETTQLKGNSATKRTDKSFCKLGFTRTETSKGEYKRSSNEIDFKGSGKTSYALNEVTTQAVAAGVTTGLMSVSARNEATIKPVSDISLDTATDLATTVTKDVFVSLASVAVGDMMESATGCSGLGDCGTAVIRVSSEFCSNGATAALQTAGRELQGKGVRVVGNLVGVPLPVPKIECNLDGSVKRFAVTLPFGSEAGIGTRNRHGAGVTVDKDGNETKWTVDREEKGVQLKKALLMGAASVDTNFGKCSEIEKTSKETWKETNATETHEEQLTGMSGKAKVLGFEFMDLKTGRSVKTATKTSQGLLFGSKNSETTEGNKILGIQVSTRVTKVANEHNVTNCYTVSHEKCLKTGTETFGAGLDFVDINITFDGKSILPINIQASLSMEGKMVLEDAVAATVRECFRLYKERGDAFSIEDVKEISNNVLLARIKDSTKNIYLIRGVSCVAKCLDKHVLAKKEASANSFMENAKRFLSTSVAALICPVVNQLGNFFINGKQGLSASQFGHDCIKKLLIQALTKAMATLFPAQTVGIKILQVLITTSLPRFYDELQQKLSCDHNSVSLLNIIWEVLQVFMKSVLADAGRILDVAVLQNSDNFVYSSILVPLLIEFGPMMWQALVQIT